MHEEKRKEILEIDADPKMQDLNAEWGTQITCDFDMTGFDPSWDKLEPSRLCGKVILGIQEAGNKVAAYKAALKQNLKQVLCHFAKGNEHKFEIKNDTFHFYMSPTAGTFGLSELVTTFLSTTLK